MLNVVLFEPEIPGNTGNIMRTCVAINAKLDIIGPLSFSLDEKSLKRAGMDYIDSLKYQYFPTYEDYLKEYPNADTYYVTRYSKDTYTSFDFSRVTHDIFLMFGRESTGIPHQILKEHKDRLLRIPMVPEARSLNLSNSVAIVVYEVLRQQKFPNLSTHEAIKGEDFLFNEKD